MIFWRNFLKLKFIFLYFKSIWFICICDVLDSILFKLFLNFYSCDLLIFILLYFNVYEWIFIYVELKRFKFIEGYLKFSYDGW